MKFASIIVWFNPSEKEVNNILSYSFEFEKVYIIDNSDSNNSGLSSKISNSVYIPLMKNTGIACALNKGFEKALSDGFDYVMTMDQDSSWSKEELKKYLLWSEKIFQKGGNEVSVAPTADLKHKSLIGKILYFFIDKLPCQKDDIETKYVDTVICSANIVSVKAWEKIGGFNEKLFIDEVDNDFCFRLRDCGFKISVNKKIIFNHTLGNNKLTLLPKLNRHSDFRLYYIFRNIMYIIKKYPVYAKKYDYESKLSKLIWSTCIFDFHFLKHRKILKHAEKDLKNIL